jgi:phage gp36-like protein
VTAYASGTDLTIRYDIDMIGDLATDDREELDRAAVALHPNVLAALDDASGEIESALLAGGRYTASQLGSLTGNTLNHLKRITCAVAISLLLERRPSERYQELAAAYAKVARGHLESLRRGENVFGLTEIVEAGTIDTQTITVEEVIGLNSLPTRMSRYFPGIEQRLPR